MSTAADIQEQVNSEATGVLTNSMVLMASKAVSWGLAFVMTVMLPRYLGAAGFGRLYFAIALTTIAGMLVEFGLNSLVTREVAREHDRAWSYLVAGAGMKVLLWAVAFLVIVFGLTFTAYPGETRLAVVILAVAVIFTSLGSLVTAVLQALDSMRWIAVGQVAEKASLTVLGVTVLLAGQGIIAVALVMLVSSIVGLGVYSWGFWRVSRVELVHHGGIRELTVRALFVRCLPFFSVVFFGAIYFRVDAVILSAVSGDAAVGWYGAAYKLFEVLTFFPQVLMFAFFPVFSRLSLRDDESLGMAARKSLDWLLAVAIPLAVGTLMLADQIVEVLYGRTGFGPTVLPLRILAVAIIFLYANTEMVWLLVVTERQSRLAVTAAIAAVLNVVLNLFLIPRVAQNGAAAATLVTEIAVLSLNVWFLPRALTRRISMTVPAKAAAAAGIMAGVLYVLRGLPLFANVAIGIVVYAAAALALGALPNDDITMMKQAFRGLLPVRPGTRGVSP